MALKVLRGGFDRVAAQSGLDRFVFGRGYILLVVAMLAGLVLLNIDVLKSSDGFGRYSQQSAELKRQNTILREGIARLSSSERILDRAKALGLAMPNPDQFKYLRSRGERDTLRASRTIESPLESGTKLASGTPAQSATPPSSGGVTQSPVAQSPSMSTPQSGVGQAPSQAPAAQPGAATAPVSDGQAHSPGTSTGGV